MITSFFFFFQLIPFATPLEFSLPSITPDNSNSINATGDAYISINGIQLTPDPNDYPNSTSSLQHKIGRATYFQPLHLWDNATGKITDFSTNFTFVIQGENYGEGITFFLSPNGSNIPPDSGGGGLGLVNENGTSTFVAVEFDTYRNTWEPSSIFPINHVGININKMWSVENEYWASGISNGRTNEAQIKYDSSTKNLSVTYFKNGGAVFQNLYYLVDLSAHLPEWVTFGFSGSTGSAYEKNSIQSWEFSTSLLGIDEGGKEAAKGGNKTGLVVGLSVGFGVLVLIGLIFLGLWRKSRGRKKDEPLPIRERSMDDEFKRGTGARKFSYEELEIATENFSEERKLGAGGFGGVYRGFLKEMNSDVAVKRVSRESKQGLKEAGSKKGNASEAGGNLVQLWLMEDVAWVGEGIEEGGGSDNGGNANLKD
ncbi:hypothetical protein C3L33_21081, partial [Rhododendron williamsianum]